MNQISAAIIDVDDDLKLPAISDAAAVRLADVIEHVGIAEIPSYINSNMLTQLQEMVVRIVADNGGEYTALTGKAEIAGTLLERIGATPDFRDLMCRVYEKGQGRAAPTQSLYQVLRCLSGRSGSRHAYFFHYDSYVVTALLPIIIPQEGLTGDLVVKPNHRKVRGSYLMNLIDKILVDNKFAQKYFFGQACSLKNGFVKIKIIPGNLYLFWGYRTLHANEPCDPQMIRATALFHFGDPHAASRLRKITGRAAVRATADPAVTPA